MNRNTSTRFSKNPANIDIERSAFDRSSEYKTTFNAGDLIPFYCDEVLAGDTWRMDTSFVCRMATPIFPVLDTAFFESWFFFVPARILWSNWKAMNGEADPSAYDDPTEYVVPTCNAPEGGFTEGSLADYFGLPTKVKFSRSISVLPGRAYRFIYNEYFRDQNLIDPVFFNNGGYVSQDLASYVGAPLKAAKRHDYFTSALPAPQKGPSVLLPLRGFAPVIPMAENWSDDALRMTDYNFPHLIQMTSGSYGSLTAGSSLGANMGGSSGLNADQNASLQSGYDGVTFANLGADLAGVEATVNEMRTAFAIQRVFERDARGGSRYREFLKNHFGVTLPDATAQIPEYLGGTSQIINMSQVVQQSATDQVTPQGNVSGMSKTVGKYHAFSKSFTEPGYIIGLCTVRTLRSYQQGINKLWMRKSRFDFYLPALAHLGEQAISTDEIYASDDQTLSESVFGYQERWAEYRYKPSIVTGKFRSNAVGTLDSWHYADDYATRPYLSQGWIEESSSNVDRTIAVQDEPQFILDAYFKVECARPMPLYSVPGLIDHF